MLDMGIKLGGVRSDRSDHRFVCVVVPHFEINTLGPSTLVIIGGATRISGRMETRDTISFNGVNRVVSPKLNQFP